MKYYLLLKERAKLIHGILLSEPPAQAKYIWEIVRGVSLEISLLIFSYLVIKPWVFFNLIPNKELADLFNLILLALGSAVIAVALIAFREREYFRINYYSSIFAIGTIPISLLLSCLYWLNHQPNFLEYFPNENEYAKPTK